MRLKELQLKDFGPFHRYKIPFIEGENICILVTGKNNEGKSNIILALRLVQAAARVINKAKQRFILDENTYYALYQQDVQNFILGRLIHNYGPATAQVRAIFNDNFEITVFINQEENRIYTDYDGRIPQDAENLFGFMPPLGPLAETEDVLSETHVKANLNSTLAARHIRNHLAFVLSKSEFNKVREIVSKSWENIELLNHEINGHNNEINVFYTEGRMTREISWAGQGLQVWFQIVTHLVRLRNSSVLILDEPEINLHPEKQNELIRILRDYYNGSVIIATHSVELMNNVSVSHIIHIEKAKRKPTIKSTTARSSLELIRSQIGSNFNLVASQFDDFEIVIFTEDTFDFSVISKLAKHLV